MVRVSPTVDAAPSKTATWRSCHHDLPPSEPPPQGEWIVRPVTPADESALVALMRDCYGTLLAADYAPEVLAEGVPLFARVRQDLLSCPTWYVALHPDTGAIVGCGGYTRQSPELLQKIGDASAAMGGVGAPRSPDGLGVPHLCKFATDPAHARRGIGRALWDRIWADICTERDESDNEPELEVISTVTAVPFYRSLGFHEVQTTVVHLTPTCPFACVLMRRAPAAA